MVNIVGGKDRIFQQKTMKTLPGFSEYRNYSPDASYTVTRGHTLMSTSLVPGGA